MSNVYDINSGLTLEDVEKIKEAYLKTVNEMERFINHIRFGLVPSDTTFEQWKEMQKTKENK